jgi:hypothetical protein
LLLVLAVRVVLVKQQIRTTASLVLPGLSQLSVCLSVPPVLAGVQQVSQGTTPVEVPLALDCMG